MNRRPRPTGSDDPVQGEGEDPQRRGKGLGDLGSRITSGAAWMVLARVVTRAMGLVSTVIVARLLAPADFGLVAMATSLYALVVILGKFNFDEAVIQRTAPERAHYDTAWTLNLALGVGGALVLVALARPAAAFFGEPRLDEIVLVMAVAALLSGTDNIGIVAFQKDLEMGKLFRLQVFRKLASFTVTVAVAYALRSYWALVAGIVAGHVAFVGVSYGICSYRPRLTLTKWRDLIGFSKWNFGSGLLGFGNEKSSHLIIGKLAGAGSLGLYNVALEVASMVSTELVRPVNQALFPGYTQVKANGALLRHYFLKTLSVVTLIAFPTAAGLAVVAGDLVVVLLGSGWTGLVPMLRILALFGALHALLGITRSIFLAVGRPDLTTYFATLNLVLLVPSLIWAVLHYGVTGAAWAQVGVTALILAANLAAVIRLLDLPAAEMGRVVVRPLVATTGMVAALGGLALLISEAPSGLRLLMLMLGGAGAFSVFAYAFWRMAGRPDGGERFVLDQVRKRLPTALAWR